MSSEEKLKMIAEYLKNTRKEIDECVRNDREYINSRGNGINCCEASEMFREVEAEIGFIVRKE